MPEMPWKNLTSRLPRIGREIVGLDLRSLGLMRIFLGAIILIDLVVRSTYLRIFYSDEGLLPRYAVLDFWHRPTYLSLHMVSGHWLFQALLFLVAACAGLCFLVGFRTRLAGFITWFLLISLHIRNPLVLNGGDIVFRLLLFWSLFLPLGARFSFDSLLGELEEDRPRKSRAPLFASVGSAGFILQLAGLYAVSTLHKIGTTWNDGTAVYYAANVDYLAEQPQADWLRGQPELMAWLTDATFIIELWVPFLLLMPFFRGPIRTLVCLQFIILHLAFTTFFAIGLFPWICIAGWVGILPGWLWDRTRLRDPETESPRLSIRSRWWVQVLAVFALIGVVQWNLATLPEARACPNGYKEKGAWCMGRDTAGLSSALIRSGDCPTGYDEQGAICQRRSDSEDHYIELLDEGCPYTYVEEAGYCRSRSPKLSQATHKRQLSWLEELKDRPVDDWVKPWARMLRLDQSWNMFAPNPLRDDGWVVIPGQQVDGTEVELLHGGELSWAKPTELNETFPDQRWRKYVRNIYKKNYKELRLYWGKQLCRDWNREHAGDQRLETLQIYFIRERTPPPDQSEEPFDLERVKIWSHTCFKKSKEK